MFTLFTTLHSRLSFFFFITCSCYQRLTEAAESAENCHRLGCVTCARIAHQAAAARFSKHLTTLHTQVVFSIRMCANTIIFACCTAVAGSTWSPASVVGDSAYLLYCSLFFVVREWSGETHDHASIISPGLKVILLQVKLNSYLITSNLQSI